MSIRKPPLPLRERAGTREIKMEALGILNHYHPHPSFPEAVKKLAKMEFYEKISQ